MAGAFAALLALASCAPRLAPPGPGGVAPALSTDAFVAGDGLKLVVQSWLPSGEARAVIVALHGYNDYANAFAMPGPFLAERGIAVYAYDQRGFGRSTSPGLWGGEAMILDARLAIGLAASRHPGAAVHVLGDSMGGAVAIAALARDPPPELAGVILVAPAVRGREVLPLLYRATLWLATHTLPFLHLSPEGLDILPSDNREMLRALSSDPLVLKRSRVDALAGLVDLMDRALQDAPVLRARTLLLYGRRDEVIPPPGIKRLIERLPRDNLTVALYEQGYHMLLRDLQGETVWRDLAAWIAGEPLPSQADRGPPLADEPLPRKR